MRLILVLNLLFLFSCDNSPKKNKVSVVKDTVHTVKTDSFGYQKTKKIKAIVAKDSMAFEAFLLNCSPKYSGRISPHTPPYIIAKYTTIFEELPYLNNKEFFADGKGVYYHTQSFIQCHLRMGNDSISYHCLLLFDKKGNQKDMKFFTSYVKDGSKDKLIASYVYSADTTLVLYDYMPGEHELLMTTTDNCQKGERWIVTQEGKFKLLEEFTCPEEDR